jgi:hypothetical protein
VPASRHCQRVISASAGSRALTLTLNHASTVHANGELALTAAGSGGDYLKGAGVLDNFGLLATLSGKGEGRYLDGSIVNEASGTLSIATGASSHGGTVQGSGTTLVSQGTLNVLKGAEYDVAAGATLTQAGGGGSNDRTLQVSGTVNKQGGSAGGSAWRFLKGALLQDKAGAGSYTFTGSGTLSGTIAAGQTVTVDGDAGTNVNLGLDGDVTNNGTLVLTSSGDHGDAGDDAGVTPAPGSIDPTLDNNGTVATTDGSATSSSGEALSGGDSGIRYLGVDVTNEAGGTLKIDAGPTRSTRA